MANRYFPSQFSYSFERMCVSLMGSITQSSATGSKAVLVANGITYTAKEMGTAGNSITIALVAGGTAGAEVVTVTGTAISIQIESTVTTRTQVETAINASTAALALITVSVASGGTAATLSAAAPLATGTSTAFTVVGLKGTVIDQPDTGLIRVTLDDAYTALVGASMEMILPTAKDLKAQIKSADTSSAQTVIIRTVAVATATDMASGDGMMIRLDLRNSSS